MDRLVRDIMKIGVPTCKREDNLIAVARIMAQENADALIVMDEFGACGVISQSDLAHAFSRNYALLCAQDVMHDQIVAVEPDAPIMTAANLMQDEKVHQLFVMHQHPGPSRPSAVITMRAIVREMAGLAPERPAVAAKKSIGRETRKT